MTDDAIAPTVSQTTLAAWRAGLVKIRDGERQSRNGLSPEIGRLLETVGQALAQGGGSLPPDDVARIEELTRVNARYVGAG